MERNLYFENYLNNKQKDSFEYAYDNGYDIVTFISCYMKSYARRQLDKSCSSWQLQPAERIAQEVLDEYKNITIVKSQTINRDAVEWLGFFYSKWHFLTGEASKTILRFLSPKEGLKKYYVLHQLDELEAIEMCKRHYNQSRNVHRLNEYKNSDESNVIYDNPIYYSFLAVKALYKLTRIQIYKEMNYVGDYGIYDFVDDNNLLGIKSDIINNNNIIERYEIINRNINRQDKQVDTSINFCFVISGESLAEETIKEFKNKYVPKERMFNYIYFYSNGKIYEITSSNELFTYVLPFSNRDKSGIINKIKILNT